MRSKCDYCGTRPVEESRLLQLSTPTDLLNVDLCAECRCCRDGELRQRFLSIAARPFRVFSRGDDI